MLLHIKIFRFIYKQDLLKLFGEKIRSYDGYAEVNKILDIEKIDFHNWKNYYFRTMKKFLKVILIILPLDALYFLYHPFWSGIISKLPKLPHTVNYVIFIVILITALLPFALIIASIYIYLTILFPNNIIYNLKNREIKKALK